jgi:hypothetical protein
MGAIPSYALQVSSGSYVPDPITTDPQQIQPNTDLLPPLQQSMNDPVQPIWDDFNLSNINNIIGDMQPMPDFDFVRSYNVITLQSLILAGLLG